jgi:hypothetical protein
MASLDDGERSSVEVSMVIWACYPFYEGALYHAEPGTRELISIYTTAQATGSVDHSKDVEDIDSSIPPAVDSSEIDASIAPVEKLKVRLGTLSMWP